jgi:hypothetical protein
MNPLLGYIAGMSCYLGLMALCSPYGDATAATRLVPVRGDPEPTLPSTVPHNRSAWTVE